MAAVEVLVANQAVSYLIRGKKIHMIKGVLQSGRTEGMIEMDASVTELLRQEKITPEVALGNGVELERVEQHRRAA